MSNRPGLIDSVAPIDLQHSRKAKSNRRIERHPAGRPYAPCRQLDRAGRDLAPSRAIVGGAADRRLLMGELGREPWCAHGEIRDDAMSPKEAQARSCPKSSSRRNAQVRQPCSIEARA